MKSTNKQHWQNPSTKELQQRKYSHFLFSEIYTTFLLRHQIFTKYSNKIMYNNTLVRWYELLEFRHIQSHVNVGGGYYSLSTCLCICQSNQLSVSLSTSRDKERNLFSEQNQLFSVLSDAPALRRKRFSSDISVDKTEISYWV